MNEQVAVDLLKSIEAIGIPVWIGGGWGIDALIGSQTRPHDDIDVYIEKRNGDAFIEMLFSKGYSEVQTEYTTAEHTVWRDFSGNTVDLHLFEFGETDTLCFMDWTFPANVLNGEGIVGGIKVQCFTAEAQLLFHQGYEHSKKDVKDVLLLCKTFGFDVPSEYS